MTEENNLSKSCLYLAFNTFSHNEYTEYSATKVIDIYTKLCFRFYKYMDCFLVGWKIKLFIS